MKASQADLPPGALPLDYTGGTASRPDPHSCPATLNDLPPPMKVQLNNQQQQYAYKNN